MLCNFLTQDDGNKDFDDEEAKKSKLTRAPTPAPTLFPTDEDTNQFFHWLKSFNPLPGDGKCCINEGFGATALSAATFLHAACMGDPFGGKFDQFTRDGPTCAYKPMRWTKAKTGSWMCRLTEPSTADCKTFKKKLVKSLQNTFF